MTKGCRCGESLGLLGQELQLEDVEVNVQSTTRFMFHLRLFLFVVEDKSII